MNCLHVEIVDYTMEQKLFLISILLFISGTLLSQAAPDFSFSTIEEKIESLSDLKGEVLYVSFWASWCKPCINNFEKYEEMRAELAEIGVVLLNVNIDKDESNWHSAMVKHKIIGTHVRGNDLDELQEVYELYSIPSYEIINKRGDFVYLSTSPNRNIIQEFKEWVKE